MIKYFTKWSSLSLSFSVSLSLYLSLSFKKYFSWFGEETRWQSRRTLSSPPLTSTPKSQLTAEQPLIKKTGTYPKKRHYTSKDIKKKPNKMVGGMHSPYNQIPYLLGGQPTNWRIIILQKFSHRSESSEPHIRLPSLGVCHWEEDPTEHLALKASGAWVQELHRTGGNRDSAFGGAHKMSHTPWPRAKAVTSDLGQIYLLVLGCVLRRQRMAIALSGIIKAGGRNIRECSSTWTLVGGRHLAWVISTKTWPYPTACRLQFLRPNNQQGGNTTPPINRQAA